MNRSAWCAAAVAALALLAAPPRARAADPFQLVTVDEVTKMLGQPDVRVYDANDAETYAAAHLPGATFVAKPLADKLPKEKTARLVFYCKNPK